MNSKVKNRLRKLLELSRRGVEGEKVSAERLLNKLLEKHNLSIEDIDSDIKRLRFYNYTTLDKQEIICQIICMVTDNHEVGLWTATKKLGVEATDYEHAQIMELMDFHLTQYAREKKKLIKDLPVAYINKHNIFRKNAEPDDTEKEDIDWDKIARVSSLANTMENVSYAKKLTEGA